MIHMQPSITWGGREGGGEGGREGRGREGGRGRGREGGRGRWREGGGGRGREGEGEGMAWSVISEKWITNGGRCILTFIHIHTCIHTYVGT